MQFRVLGPLEIETDGGLLPLRGAKQRALLGLLLMNPNEVVSRDLLIEGLWGETADERAGHTLEAQVSRLRKSLRPAGGQLLLTRGTGYQLNVGADELDVLLFERLLEQAGSALGEGDAAGAAATIREALALWRGRPFEDVTYESFARIEIERLEELRLSAVEDRMEAELLLGGHAQLIPELEAMVRTHPLRERVRAQLMLALSRRTITITGLTLTTGQKVVITYGSKAGSGRGAAAPSGAVGAQKWKTSERSNAEGTLTALASSPSIRVRR